MAPRTSVDDRLRLLSEVRRRSDPEEIRQSAGIAIRDKSHLIIAEAARLIAAAELSDMVPELLSAWERLIAQPDQIKADKCCVAKTALIEALAQLGHDDPELFLFAVRYSQIEPAWQKADDAAEQMRAAAAFALARSQRLRAVDKMNAFVDLLHGTPSDQVAAPRAIADTASEMAIPLLRMHLLSGAADVDSLGASITGLMTLAAQSSIPIIEKFLYHSNENLILEAAANLGQSRLPAATAALITKWKRTSDKELQRSILISLGLSRSPEATDFLIALLESGEQPDDVLDALSPACVYQDTQDRVRKTLREMKNQDQLARFENRYRQDK